MNYFPNTTQLTFEHGFSITHHSIGAILNRIIPLKQLTKLVIICFRFSFIKMIELLHFTPSLHTLKFRSMLLYGKDYMLIQQSETFRLVSSMNTIRDVTCSQLSTLQQLQLLVALCPRVQCLTIDTSTKDLKLITEFLIDKINQNATHLFSLCITRDSNYYVELLHKHIKSKIPSGDDIYERVGGNIYFWW
jgi:hypothetical protein